MITSGQNKALKQARSLSLRKGREKSGLFAIEGARAVGDAFRRGAELKYVFAREDYRGIPDVKCPVYILPARLFAELSETGAPQGILAVCKVKKASLSDIAPGENSLVIICENLQDPGNLGSIIRTADAVGACGAALTKGCVDLYNPKTVRATMSSIFAFPIATGVDISEAAERLKKAGVKIFAGALSDQATGLYDADFSGKAAIIVGNEGAGLSEKALALADHVIKIPMKGGAESLNAAAACAVMAYEHFRANQSF